MPRIAPPQPVDPKLFRHFVIITLVLSGLLAMFASGENSEALQEKLAEKQRKEELKAAELELAKQGKGGNTALVFKDNRSNKGAWGADPSPAGMNYAPSDEDGSPELVAKSGPRFIDLANTAGEASTPSTVAPPGMASLDLAEVQKKRKKQAQSSAPTRRPPPPEGDEEY